MTTTTKRHVLYKSVPLLLCLMVACSVFWSAVLVDGKSLLRFADSPKEKNVLGEAAKQVISRKVASLDAVGRLRSVPDAKEAGPNPEDTKKAVTGGPEEMVHEVIKESKMVDQEMKQVQEQEKIDEAKFAGEAGGGEPSYASPFIAFFFILLFWSAVVGLLYFMAFNPWCWNVGSKGDGGPQPENPPPSPPKEQPERTPPPSPSSPSS